MTFSKLTRIGAASAIVAGLLFVIIQPIHPSDTLASVTTGTWATVHYLTLVMTVLFLAGMTGIYARQLEQVGWLGFIGYTTLGLGLLITGAFVFIESFVSPVLAASQPQYVEGLLSLVGGSEVGVDLGLLPDLWAVSGILFPLGCLVFGVAVLRARVLSRPAAVVFAFGLPVAVLVVALLPFDLHRLGAIPVGVGLAWLGISLWSRPA